MKLKKIISAGLVIGILSLNVIPAYSIENTCPNNSRKSLFSKEKNKTDKSSYINFNWWYDFEDELLNDYIMQAIENNYDLKITSSKVEQARQNVKVQFASELPSVTVGASPSVSKMTGETSANWGFMIPIIASYEVDIFLKNRDKTKSVKKIYEAAQLNEHANYLAIVSAVGSTYYNIVKADKLIEIQKKLTEERKEIARLMKLRNDFGISSTSDLVQAEKSFILAESDLIELERQRDLLLTSFAVLLGDSPENIMNYKRISYDEIKNKKIIPDEISTEVITSRPDYKAAEKMIEKAGIDVRVAKKEFLPSFNLGGLLGLMTVKGVTGMPWENALAGAGLFAMLPLFTGGKKIANFKFQKAKYVEMLNEYQKTNIVAIKEVNDALKGLKYTNKKVEKDLYALDKEIIDYNMSKDKFDQGVISKLDLIQKNEILLSTQKLAVSENINLLINHISLYKATAGYDY